MSEIKVNKISPRTACGTTTLGDSGDTFTIPSRCNNHEQWNCKWFWSYRCCIIGQTTVKTSGNFTATAGEGYFVDTTSGAISVNLTSRNCGSSSWFCRLCKNILLQINLTLVQNGSDKSRWFNQLIQTVKTQWSCNNISFCRFNKRLDRNGRWPRK